MGFGLHVIHRTGTVMVDQVGWGFVCRWDTGLVSIV